MIGRLKVRPLALRFPLDLAEFDLQSQAAWLTTRTLSQRSQSFIVIGVIIGFGLAPTMVTLVGYAIGGADALRYGLALCGAFTSVAATLGFAMALIKAR